MRAPDPNCGKCYGWGCGVSADPGQGRWCPVLRGRDPAVRETWASLPRHS
jgi:hypothetical protein